MKAQRESMSISGNMKRGAHMRMKNGTFFTSATPYGYKLDGRTLEIVPEEAKVVKRIYSDYLSGKGFTDIADTLNKEGVPPRAGHTKWRIKTTQYILTNVSYIGDMLWQKKYTTDTLPLRQVINRGEKKQYYVQNDHEPIISREEFEKVQTLIAERGEQFRSGEASERLLAKKVLCGECGSTFRYKAVNGVAYWMCRTRDSGKDRCPVAQLPESEILSAYRRMADKLRAYGEYVLDPMTEQLEAVAERRERSNTQLSEINREIADVAGQIHTLNSLNAKGALGASGESAPALFISKSNELNKRLQTLRRTKIRLLDEDGQSSKIQAVADLIDALKSDIDYDELFSEIVERVIVNADDTLRFRLRCGLELTETVERAVRYGGLAKENAVRLFG
jgi:hypothetical protein